ncbi:MAG: ATP synthase F1 subunit epsilon [Clostridia bacterium]|nr:ATP synthase F1 subunit epsilon [Clostridia bacterium]
MATFHLQIVTPDRMVFDGEAQSVILRTVHGDVCILPHHIDFAIPLQIGQASVTDAEGNTRQAACNGGMLSVNNNEVRVVAVTFEWADEIDLERAKRAEAEAEERLQALNRADRDFILAEARLKRAITRIHAKEM